MHNTELETINEDNWESALIEWEKKKSPDSRALCLARVLAKIADPVQQPLLEAIIRQYQQPDPQRRRKIFDDAEQVGFDTAVGALALSQFFAEGSLSPDDLTPIYPPNDLSTKMLHSVAVIIISELAENPAEGCVQLITRCHALEV